MKFLTDRGYAEELLKWAEVKNPGRWIDHSRYVAKAAEKISKEMKKVGFEIDPNIAYICGLLHDIGRYKGFTPSVIHSYDGYNLLMKKGYEGNANVCITHSFPIKTELIEAVNGWNLVPKDIQEDLMAKMKSIEWNIYDRLLTLCDALAETDGYTVIERRLVSVAIRSGTNEDIPKHWKGFFEIKHEIEEIIGMSVYSLFPGIENSIFNPIALTNPK